MLEGLDGALKRRARELGLHRADELSLIQHFLDQKYPGKCRAVSLNEGMLKISTTSASVSSELHWAKFSLIRQFPGVKKIKIQPN